MISKLRIENYSKYRGVMYEYIRKFKYMLTSINFTIHNQYTLHYFRNK